MININEARSKYNLQSGQYLGESQDKFATYSHAYVTSNENLPMIMSEMRPCNKTVLTVAGSGDQPMFFMLYGASLVDTFDLSYCAKVMMDIKTAAIQSGNRAEYVDFLTKMLNSSCQIENLALYNKCKDKCPAETQRFVENMRGCKICRPDPIYFENVPSDDEFVKLKKLINKPFDFIWSDLQNLSGKLNRTYDQIYLSNILEYNCNYDSVYNVITNMLPRLNNKGQIMLYATPYFTYDEMCLFKKIQDALKKYMAIRIAKYKDLSMCIVNKL